MTDKLQQLTDRLYQEGISKGREEAEKIVEQAQIEAEEILAKARKEAADITSQAEKKSAELKSATQKDIKKAADQSIVEAKRTIENLLAEGTLSSGAKALEDADFVKEIIKAVAERFSTDQDIAIMLPESLKEKTEGWLKTELKKAIGKGINAGFSNKISGGFTIGPADGSYYVSITEDTVRELIAEFLRPATRKVLFGE